MRSYSNFSLRDLLDAFAATAPAPGGGSAAALAGATAVSLLLMAAGIRASRSGAASSELAESTDRLRSLRPTIAAQIDRDADAYTSVIAALRMPVNDPETEVRQRTAYESAMRAATDAPLETVRACRRALREAPVVAAHSTRGTRGDVAVAIELLRAAVRSAAITVEANLGSLRDLEYVGQVRTELEQLENDSRVDAELGLSRLPGPSR